MAHDAIVAASSFVLSLHLRYGDNIDEVSDVIILGALVFTVVCTTVFSMMRLYRGLWRFASLQDLVTIVKASSLSILMFLLLMFFFTRLEGIPRSAMFINWMLLIIMLSTPRFLYRIVKDKGVGLDLFSLDKRIPVLMVGANTRTEMFIRDSQRTQISAYRVVGVIDSNKSNKGRLIHGVKIYGDLTVADKVIKKLERKGAKPQKMIVSDDSLTGGVLRGLLEAAEFNGVALTRLPALTEFKEEISGNFEVRPIQIEDLLGRAQNALDYDAMRSFLEGRRVLVTGAGGTIGGELVRQIANFSPSSLIMIDNSEFNLYEIEREISSSFPELNKKAIYCDVRDLSHIRSIFREEKPEVIFHAAAIKHVRIAEENAEEAILTNVFGTKNVCDTAKEFAVDSMVLISTDKAVNPSSVMGASKRIAETYINYLNSLDDVKTKFMTVRFGNVLGSKGSVIPLFQEKIAKRAAISVTHPDVTRYFMTLREAVGLVILTSTLSAKSDYQGGIYVLDMGQPVRIKDMAEQMIKLSGLQPDIDIKIEFSGLGKGEKIHEELFYFSESPVETIYGGVLLARSSYTDKASLSLQDLLNSLKDAADKRDGTVKTVIKSIVPEANMSN